MDQKQFASLGGLAAAKALTAEQRIERATVASDAARIARAALRKAKALGIAKPDTASRRWRQTRRNKALAKSATHEITRLPSSQHVAQPYLHPIPQRVKGLFRSKDRALTPDERIQTEVRRATIARKNNRQIHDFRKPAKKGRP